MRRRLDGELPRAAAPARDHDGGIRRSISADMSTATGARAASAICACTEIKERTVEGVRVMQVIREIDWDDGTKTFAIGAQLIGPDRSFTPRQRLAEARVDGEQFRRIPAPDGQHRGHAEAEVTFSFAHRVPTVARAVRIGNNASNKTGEDADAPCADRHTDESRCHCRRSRRTTSCCAAWARFTSAGASPR